ncbi:cholecystokinin receptor type A-like [Dermacentor andersoni]|uniref:cholecystokinin receptor type A-like n=1 Tax=Dermacentor andersoni TaxID=34620 RepID=UPI002155749E|nr:cholecystokinin receptor type A-like [Dermacentor andersoni]
MVNRLMSSLPLLDLRQPLYNKTPSPPFTELAVPTVVLPDVAVFTEFPDGVENSTSHPDSISAVDGLPDAADLIVRVCLYAVIFVFAVVGNVLVLVTLVQNKRMRTVTNVFLVNLAVSDLLLGVFCMPFTLIGSILRNFVFGELMCKFIPYLQAVSVSVSVWTLVSISLERFFAIVRPLQSRRWQTVSHAYRVIAVVWALSLVHVAPIAVLSQLIPTRTAGRQKCRELWHSDEAEKGFNLYLDSVLLVLPLLIMIVVYAIITRTLCVGIRLENRSVALGIPMKSAVRENDNGSSACSDSATPTGREEASFAMTTASTNKGSKFSRSANGVRCQTLLVRGCNPERAQASMVRVIRMLFVVVVEFFVCWTPLYVVHTWSLYDPDTVYDWLGSAGVSVVHLLAYASSCSNPITYCFMHQKFRQGFLTAVGCRRGIRGRCGGAGSCFARQSSVRGATYASGTTLVYQDTKNKVPNGRGADFV